MLRHLFLRIGYAWSVRASTLLSAACCLVSVFTVRSRGRKKCTAWIDVKMLNDGRFMLLATGSFFICLGKKQSHFMEVIFDKGTKVYLLPFSTSHATQRNTRLSLIKLPFTFCR